MLGLHVGPIDGPHVARIITWARGALGESTFGAEWAEGSSVPLGLLVADELAVQHEAAVAGVSATRHPARQHAREMAGLTARENEVAELIVQGLSNREIAAALVIARRTADTHVGNVLTKLQVHTRAQVAVWMVERRLTT